MKYAIIGNSAAGIWAAQTLREQDAKAEITIISREDLPSYSRCLLADYLTGEKNEKDLYIRSRDFYRDNSLDTLFGLTAVSVDTKSRNVVLSDGSWVPFDKLLLATGADAWIPPIPGIQSEKVYGLRDINDARAILAASKNARKAVVVGGGFVGLETAYALRKKGLDVAVVEKLSRILPLQMDETAASILQEDMKNEGITFHLSNGVKSVETRGIMKTLTDNSLKKVNLEDGSQLEADFVVVTVGIKPNTELAESIGARTNCGIVVDSYMETSVPGIYAAGDVTETKDLVTGQVDLFPIWPNACIQGRTAALNMAGSTRKYSGEIGLQNSVEFREIPAIAMGNTNPDSLDAEVIVCRDRQKGSYRKLVIEDGCLTGMILVGNIEQAGIYGGLIRTGRNISSLRDVLPKDSFNYAHVCEAF